MSLNAISTPAVREPGPLGDPLRSRTVAKVITALLRNDLILIDELGFEPLDDTGA